MKSLFHFTLLLACSLGLTAQARPLTLEQKLQDYNQLVSYINANYGPLEYKTQAGVVDVRAHTAKFDAAVRNTTSNREFYYTIAQYIAGFKDGHFGVKIPSTHIASIPAAADLVDGKILITKIDRTKLSEAVFNFAIGDEIVSIDGLSAVDYLRAASRFVPDGNDLGRLRKSAWSIFFRRAERLPVSNRQTLKLMIRRGTSSVVEPAELKWNFTGLALDEADDGSASSLPLGIPFGLRNVNFDRLVNESVNDFRHPIDRDFACNGTTRIAIPNGATMLMTDPFTAYYYPTAKGNIGYLRIPHYYPTDPVTGEFTQAAALVYFQKYEYAIRALEKNTVGLIIDQDHNCGGSIALVHSMLSLFMDKPFAQSQFQLLANKESYLEVKQWVDETPENTLAREAVQKVLDLVQETWLRGTTHLTKMTPIDGVELVQPNLVRYSKPVVVTIDEVSGSGGDMFPAMIQGLGRAKLIGKTTGGLGGHVEDVPTGLPNSQIKFRITKSLFYRPNGTAIENVGAIPDREYTITRDDVLYGFKDYQKTVEAYLFAQIP